MREDIIDYLHSEVERRCKLPTNFFGMGCYYHIESVVKNAELLAKQYGADIEIVIIASWLHDIASITDYSLYEKHHIYGAQTAKELLSSFDYEDYKIEMVQKCILNHRGSVQYNKLTLEEVCVADADAVSHFDDIPGLLYLAYVKKGLDIEHGKVFVKEKLERSYQKLSNQSKKFYASKYNQAMMILE
ncbi:MAG: HD domain-containing protein [Lachnospiraceae bacterium]|nr:HD domain-containing protein [Lachnospiraceae bacterium]